MGKVTKENMMEIVDSVFVDAAKKLYVRDKRVDPLFVMFHNNESPEIVAIPSEYMAHKDIVSKVLKHAVKENKEKIIGALFICEAWAVQMKQPENGKMPTISGSLKDHPQRKEIIMVTFESKNYIKSKLITVEDGKIKEENKWIDIDKSDGRFASFGLYDTSELDKVEAEKRQKKKDDDAKFDNNYIR